MKQAGFTLIELMIALVMVGIITAIAIPSFDNAVANNRVSSTANNVVGALNLARVEAAQRGTNVTISSVSGGGNWGSQGYRIWLDADADGNYDAGEELRVFDAAQGALTLTETSNTPGINFTASGFASGALVLNLCSTDTNVDDRQIAISLSGRVGITEIACP